MFKIHVRRVAIFAIAGLVAGFLIASNLPKLYEAKMDLLIDSSSSFADFDPQIRALLTRFNTDGEIETELGMLQSKGMFENAVAQVAQQRNDASLMKQAEDLYPFYQVGTYGKNSKIASLTVRARDPKTAADITDQIAAFYNDFRGKKSKESIAIGSEVLNANVKKAREDLRKSEEEVKKFKEKYRITDPQVEANQLAEYSNSLRLQLDAAEADLRSVDAQIATQKAKLSVLPKYSKTSVNEVETPQVQEYETRLAKLQADRLQALEQYQPGSERIKQFDRLISEMERKLHEAKASPWKEATKNMTVDPIRAQIESALAANEIQKRSLSAKASSARSLLSQTDAKIAALPARDQQYTEYLRQMSIRNKQYMDYLSQQESLKRQMDAAVGKAIVLFPAQAEDKPVAPDVTKLGIVGGIAGIVLGLLFSFLIESLRLPVRTSGQLADLTGLPVSATVPLMPRRQAARLLAGLPDPNYKPGEAFRFMAFSQLAREGGAPKLVLFTGIGGSVGCSSAASQFALATARTGVRTLLVDADLRHPAITTSFEANEHSGVSDMLNRTMLASDADLSIETPHKNLRLIAAGTDGEGGLADFPTSHIVGIMNNLAENADVVVIDAPPCDIVADAARLVPYVDQVCLVVSAQSTSFRSVPMAYDILKRSGAKEISLILTHASPQDEPFSKRSRYLVA